VKRRLSLAVGVPIICLAICGCGVFGSYGPAQDHSSFEGAALLSDQTVLFSFSHLVYRPATGITAFPDGGVPRYLKDEVVLGTYHVPSGAMRILRRERNKRWADGQGRFGIQRSKGSMALVTQGGQLRSDLSKNEYDDWLIETATGTALPVDYRSGGAQPGGGGAREDTVDARGAHHFG
jgi:hypothetical protein